MWASTFLTDGAIDALPDAGIVLLIKMRCICSLEGSCPSEYEEVARKTRTLEAKVLIFLPALLKFFDIRGTRLFDPQQERDAALTERGKRGADVVNARRRGAATSDATSDARSGPQPIRATSDATSGGTSDAQKLEVRSKKTEGSVHVVEPVEISAVIGPVEAVEIVEKVPAGTPSIEQLKKKSEAVFHLPSRSELERRAQEQKQKLHEWQNRKGNSNPNDNTDTEFKLA
jgi:hypothetical protein